MKKQFKKFSVLFAAVALMASCSNDEPNPGNNVPENVKGMDAYLRVNIQDAGDILGRANDPDNNNTGDAANGDYEFGTADEHAVENAKFYFYTADKVFVQEGTLTKFKGSGPAADQDNIEYFGQNVLVLKGLTTNTTPTYMVTVLNAPADFEPGATLDDTRAALSSIKNGNKFVMSTTSFVDSKFTDEYGTNKLTTNDFHTQAAGTVTPDNIFDTNPDIPAVDVYVERLAAKVEVKYNATGVNEDGYVAINIPVAGNPNNVGDEMATLSTVYIKLSNWGLNATAKESYMIKNIAGLEEPFANWNSAERKRSFWGKSVLWGQDLTTDNANFISYADAKGEFGKGVEYCAENTNEVTKIASGAQTLTGNLTHVLFTATVYEQDAEGNYVELDMVRYNGSLYKKAWFKDVVLTYLNTFGKLNYYKYVGDTEIKDEAGNVTGPKKNYKQLSADELKLDFALTQDEENKGTGMIQVVTTIKPEDNVAYFIKGTNDKGEETYTAATFDQTAIDALNTALASFDNRDGNIAVANAYEKGAMYYAIPIEHLLKRASSGTDIVEGNYGVVRNHWYTVTVDKILRLGTGVFQPGEGGELIIPSTKPEDPTYYLGARINILSWKIVHQNVDL